MRLYTGKSSREQTKHTTTKTTTLRETWNWAHQYKTTPLGVVLYWCAYRDSNSN